MQKFKILLSIFLCFSQLAMSQHVDEGAYNDWDYGPHGVYGNLKLAKVSERAYYRIARTGPGSVIVQQINPSGIVVNTATVNFSNGVLSKVEEANQWGEQYETTQYKPVGIDSFRVTDLVRGRNSFLPCKYALNIYEKELLKEVQYYSFAGKLSEDKYGLAIIRYKRYDDPVRFSEKKEIAFFDAGGRPVYSKGNEYHKLITQYDDQDNKVSDDFFGNQDEPIVPRRTGVAGWRYSYDANNHPVKMVALGLEGKVVSNINGIAAVGFEYELGYLMKQVRYDSLNNKTRALRSGDGTAIIKYEYDNAGNKVREAYFDTSGKPMNNNFGVQEIADFYSPGNMLLKEAYFDEFGRPCVNRDGIHETRYGRDEFGRIVEVANYELNDRPDANGRTMELSYWDAGNRPVDATIWFDDSLSVHRVVYIYRGARIIEQRFFKKDAVEPFQVLDCLKNDYVGPNGIAKGRRNAE